MKKILLLAGLILLLGACGNDADADAVNESPDDEDYPEDIDLSYESETTVELTAQEKMVEDIIDLIDEGKAYDSGSYTKGDIPEGEYVFTAFEGSGKYYSEEESGGSIVDNENFDSFGYVKVHDIGNIKNDGVLIDIDSIDDLEISGAKELYEKLNDEDDYKDSGWYKVGADIDPGEYVIKSHGEGYVAVMTGAVGDNEIVDNENFNGSYTVSVEEGQYLKISRGEIK